MRNSSIIFLGRFAKLLAKVPLRFSLKRTFRLILLVCLEIIFSLKRTFGIFFIRKNLSKLELMVREINPQFVNSSFRFEPVNPSSLIYFLLIVDSCWIILILSLWMLENEYLLLRKIYAWYVGYSWMTLAYFVIKLVRSSIFVNFCIRSHLLLD